MNPWGEILGGFSFLNFTDLSLFLLQVLVQSFTSMLAPDKSRYLLVDPDANQLGEIQGLSDKQLEALLQRYHDQESDVMILIELYKEVLRRHLQRTEGLVAVSITFNSKAPLNGSGGFVVRVRQPNGKVQRRFYRAGFLDGRITSKLLFTAPRVPVR